VNKTIGTIIKLIISVLLLYFLFNRYDAGTIYRTFIQFESAWVLAALVLMIVSNIFGTFQWNTILKRLSINLPLRRVFAYYFTGLFFNNFLLSFIGGDIFRVYDIRKTSGSNTAAISTVLMDRFIGFLTLVTIGVAGIFYLSGRLDSMFMLWVFPVIFITMLFVVLILFNKSLAKRFEAIGMKITPKRSQVAIREIYNSLNYFGKRPIQLLKIFLLALCVQAARVGTHYCLARSIGVSINLAFFFLFIPVITLVIALPVSFGGIGMREWSATELFRFAGVEGEDAVLFEGMAYIVAILCSLPGGLAFVFKKH
jgi:uncharacterized protein (TIRG00374 family)